MENIFVTWKNYNSKTIFFNWEIIIIDEGSKDNIIIIDIPVTIGGGIIMNASSRGKGLYYQKNYIFTSLKKIFLSSWKY
jgi:glycosyltransferase involved in cell wall biosynthesis